jgi:hypothetical protein
MPATKEELNEYNRYEVTAISTSGCQTVAGIYQTLKEAKDYKELLFRSQDLSLFIYDTIKQERVKL